MQLIHSNFFVFRAPLLPIKKFLKANMAQTEQQLSKNLRNLIIDNPKILTALMISSYGVGNIVKSWIENSSELNQRQLYTIYKYISRMAVRSTPFGLSAGIGLGYISESPTKIEILNEIKIHSRLSISYLTSKINSKTVSPDSMQGHLLLNSTVFEHAGFLRYASRNENDKSLFDRVKIKINPLLELVAEKIKAGTTFSALSDDLSKMGFSKRETKTYLHKLIDSQLISTSLEPSLSGNNYRKTLVDLPVKKVLQPLIRNVENRIDSDHNEMMKHWTEVSDKVNENLISELEINMQLESRDANIERTAVNTIGKELLELQQFFSPVKLPELELFKKKFIERYGMMEIPLLEALDSDISIGYGKTDQQYISSNPLLQSLDLSKQFSASVYNLTDMVSEKFTTFKKNIDLKIPDEIADTGYSQATDLPSTSFALGQLLYTESSVQNKDEYFFILKTWSGPSALNLMARFAYMDSTLEKELQKLAKFEQSRLKKYILAEVVYCPSGKEANILQRPELHSYEIPVLGNSFVDEKNKLPLQDLFVSIRNNRVCLRSKRLNKYIQPTISSAHNYKRANPIYRFLGDLQRQKSPLHFVWNWDEQDERRFHPRVTYKHLILARATWNIDFEENRSYDDPLIFQLRHELNIDPVVLLADGDNELYLDLLTPWGRNILLNAMKKGHVTLYEFISTENLIQNADGESFVNEIIIPFKNPTNFQYKPDLTNQDHFLRRTFEPGSAWTYLKLYCPPSEANAFLLNNLVKIIAGLKHENYIKKWFFVRYYDPNFHIRIRFYQPQNSINCFENIIRAFSTVLSNMVKNKQIWKVQYDTYERELERYSADNMEQIESLFCVSSEMAISILQLSEHFDENFTWKAAIKSIDIFFSAFTIALPERIAFLETWTGNFTEEFGLSKKALKQIKSNYRFVRDEISAFLNNQTEASKTWTKTCEKHVQNINSILNNISSDQREIISSKLDSIMHMHTNRIYHSDQKANEMVSYFYLLDFYRSTRAQHINMISDLN